MKKISILFFMMSISIMISNMSFAKSSDFLTLFNNNGTGLIVFYSCEDGESVESACRSINKETFFKFKSNGSVVISYANTEEQGTWTAKNDEVKIKDSYGITEYRFIDGIYLGTISEETGDLSAYKLSK